MALTIAYVGEHYSCTTEQIASPLIFFASLINQTKNIKFATGVMGLPQHHPVIVAAEVAMLDHMSKGRFVWGIGPGGLASDLEVFEHEDHAMRNEMVADHLKIVLDIWKSDPPYDIKGKYWNVSIKKSIYPELGIGSMSKPYQLPHPPIHISTMSPDSPTVALAIKKGWVPVTANFTPARDRLWSLEAVCEGLRGRRQGADGRGLDRCAQLPDRGKRRAGRRLDDGSQRLQPLLL